jgi:hypothetical protein
MQRIEKFGFKLEESEGTPFFNVSPNHRIRFGMETFENNSILLKQVLEDVLIEDQTTDTTFISGYIINNKRYPEKVGIGKFISINNWRETIVKDEELENDVIYSTVSNVNNSEVFKYCQKVAKGYPQAYIMFYNDNFLIYVSSDVIDIISYESDVINNLKEKYSSNYNKFYESNEF